MSFTLELEKIDPDRYRVTSRTRMKLFLTGERRIRMLHEPAAKTGKDLAMGYKTRIGVRMFLLYAIIYVGFVTLNLIRPVLMEKTVLIGLNLAAVYGFGLIVLALALALIYNHLCTAMEKKLNKTTSAGRKGGNR